MSQNPRSSSCSTADTAEKKESEEWLEVQKSDILQSRTNRYLILDFIGKGVYGKVAKSADLISAKDVAIKILDPEKSRASEGELQILEAVSLLDPVKTNIVQFFEKFEHKRNTCLVFEMLDQSLYHLMCGRHWKPLSLGEIRPIAQQLLTAFDALKGIGVIHRDLKPDNIMLVNHDNQPFRVKLIDFGLSLKTSEVEDGMMLHAIGHRAPEMILGLPFSEAIDMWALGCVLSSLYLSNHLFGVPCEYLVMKTIVDIVGQPADHLLSAGLFTNKFFKKNQHSDYPKWWLKTPMEYQLETGIEPKIFQRSVNSLDDMIAHEPEIQESIEVEDRRAFVSLLTCLLETDPEQRISAAEALKHPFVSRVHLKEEMDTSSYAQDSCAKMNVIPMDNSEEDLTPTNETEEELNVEDVPIICPTAAGSVSPGSCDDILNMPDGATAAEHAEPAVSQHEASSGPAEEEPRSDTDGSPGDGATVTVKKSRLRRIRKFFSSAIRTMFGMKKT